MFPNGLIKGHTIVNFVTIINYFKQIEIKWDSIINLRKKIKVILLPHAINMPIISNQESIKW